MISRFLKHPYSHAFYIACLMVGLFGALYAQQTREKVVRVNQATQITDAAIISNVAVAGKTVECKLFIKPPDVIQPVTPFQADNDWLQKMTISLVNRTNKTIVFGSVIFHFLDTGDCHALPCDGATLTFGQRPAVAAYDGRTGRPFKPEHPERPSLDWKPEQTIVVRVSDYMDEIKDNLSNSPTQLAATAVTKVNIYRGVFYFADGMQWTLGRYSIPDPEHPGKFKELPADYFPGRRGNNWPPGYEQ